MTDKERQDYDNRYTLLVQKIEELQEELRKFEEELKGERF